MLTVHRLRYMTRSGFTPEDSRLQIKLRLPRFLVQARPIVGKQNRVRGIRRVVLDAGGLAGGGLRDQQPFFETRDVLRGFVRHPGNRICVVNQFLRAVAGGGWTAFAKHSRAWRFFRFAGMFGNLQNLAFHDPSNAIQIRTPLAFQFARILGLSPQPENQSHDGERSKPDHGQQIAPIAQKIFQRPPSRAPSRPLVSQKFGLSEKNFTAAPVICVEPRGLRTTISIFKSPDWIAQRPDAADAYLNHIACRERPYAGRSARRDQIAWFERHRLRDPTNYNINGKNHFRQPSGLFPDAIHECLDGRIGRRRLRLQQWPEWAKRVYSLIPRPP